MPTFSDDVVAAVLHHMNDDHVNDSLLIVRAFANPDATTATMTSLDHLGGTWVYEVDGHQHEATVAWSKEISERPEIRREVAMMYNAACKRLGIDPRPH
ncbi:MAG TPA: DUF2470 domain-containing protein [Rhodoglobus sp.]|nr:DUF2470 domain-containing protein [Rhodoglobus sp.]HPG76719.1 DUF2470 domain-containing protein [Rhodoglobus sp.]HPM51644.1 DUF2470 domain-containing protein [Rhodoglobus sp.]